MARPTRLTDEVEERILNALRGGNWLDTAAAFAGVSVAAVHEWIARGKRVNDLEEGADADQECPQCGASGDEPCRTEAGKEASRSHNVRPIPRGELTEIDIRCAKFAKEVEKARAGSEVRAVTHIQEAALNGTWQAAAWFLERSHPTRWGRRRIEHEVTISQAMLESEISRLETELRDSGVDL